MSFRGARPRVDSINTLHSYAETVASASSSQPLNPSFAPSHLRQRSLESTSRAPSVYEAGGGSRRGTAPWILDQRHGSDTTLDLQDPYSPSTPSFGSDESSRATRSFRANEYGALPSPATATSGTKDAARERWLNEKDDALHGEEPLAPRVGRSRYVQESDGFRGNGWDHKGIMNIAALLFLLLALVGVFAAYPIAQHFADRSYTNTTSYIGPPTTPAAPPPVGTGGLLNDNAPKISNRALVDPDTPRSAYSKKGIDGEDMTLMFSDEFNIPGRTFYTGEDPFWEAVNFHYWATDDSEWYDPGNIVTKDGYLELNLTKETMANSHNMGYLGGMLQSWNKFCLTGARVEMAVSLPGSPTITGHWPAGWLMANLGRAGYGATLDGTWPYSYEACDIGTLANQTDPATGGPTAAISTGVAQYAGSLSYLPGQRLSACTCPGENHPGPVLADGSFAGRSASEIDIFEATAQPAGGEISQTAQWAPFNPSYTFLNRTASQVEYYTSPYETFANTYRGGAYQQGTSGLSHTNSSTYDSTTNFAMYGIDYTPTYIGGEGTGKITWYQEDMPMWTITDQAMAANSVAQVSARPVTGEPMYIILNHGMSQGFQAFDVDDIVFPSAMRVDYVRVYQPNSQINIGCDTKLFPTADYIANNILAYTNANLTTYAQYVEAAGGVAEGHAFPKNRLIDTC